MSARKERERESVCERARGGKSARTRARAKVRARTRVKVRVRKREIKRERGDERQTVERERERDQGESLRNLESNSGGELLRLLPLPPPYFLCLSRSFSLTHMHAGPHTRMHTHVLRHSCNDCAKTETETFSL